MAGIGTSDVAANLRHPADSGDLRMLDPIERKATRMAWDGADLVDIAAATSLTYRRIREAVALQARWKREPPPPGWDPDPQPEAAADADPLGEVGDLSTPLPVRHEDPGTPAAPEPTPSVDAEADAQAEAARDAELEQLVQRRTAPRPVSISMGGVDLAQTVRAGERSGDAHARALAGRIRRLVDELGAHLATRMEIDLAHQRIDTLQNEVEALKRLAQRRETRRPAARTSELTASATNAADNIRYSTSVRDWARVHGLKVAERGRIANSVVRAYLAANPADG